MRCTGATFAMCCCARSGWRGGWWTTGEHGSVINVTSIEGVRAAPGYAAYAAAKAGVINYTKTASFELSRHGIRVNALAPDLTMTEGLRSLSGGELADGLGDRIPMRRAGHVDEMASAAVFLASDMASYITGQTIHVDGGTEAAGGWYHHPHTGAPSSGRAETTSPVRPASPVTGRRTCAGSRPTGRRIGPAASSRRHAASVPRE